MLHEQAIYQHDPEQFQVERLDYIPVSLTKHDSQRVKN